MQADYSLSHEDKVKLFGVDFFTLGNYSNQEDRGSRSRRSWRARRRGGASARRPSGRG
jgi:hypothetical protein